MKHIAFIFFLFGVSKAYTQTDTTLVRKHLIALTSTPQPRNYIHINSLNQAADYIKAELKKYADEVTEQTYEVNGKTYRNIICAFDTAHAERIIVGAHYDVCEEQPGADDNASGVTGLLELARQLKNKKLNYRIDLVAYTLEEPPFFRTPNMGSYVHAKSLKDKNIKVKGMISLEMIGYFNDAKNSQKYPLGFLKLFYGNKGNFITVVQKLNNKTFGRKFKRKMKQGATIRTKSIKAPKFLTGIDFSDHLNYWLFGYSALMITDTSFYRNFNYHHAGDTVNRLDINRMSKVIDSVYQTLLNFK